MSIRVEAALRQSVATRGQALLSLSEGQWLERKSGRVQPKDLAVPLVAFANAEGGTLVVGASNGVVDGVSAARLNDLRQAAIDHTMPPVRCHAQQVECGTGGGDKTVAVLVITVPPSGVVHETRRGDCYVRVGDESRQLTFTQRQELTYDRTAGRFDATPSGRSAADLVAVRVELYRSAVGAESAQALLRARNLVSREGEATVAGYLLFGEHPQDLFPNAHVRVLKYLDLERGSGQRHTLDAAGDVRCEGPLIDQIDEARRVVRSLLPAYSRLGPSGRFEATPILPEGAWLEGIVNAVVHRSYSNAGDNVRVEIFPDRVEISSPGRFPGIVDLSDPPGIVHHARNPTIARVSADLGIGRELGEGIRRMFDLMAEHGLATPAYRQTSGSVILTLSARSAVRPELESRIGSRGMQVLEHLRQAGEPLRTGDVIDLTGLSRPVVLRTLRDLRDAELVDWSGRAPNDPQATWRVR